MTDDLTRGYEEQDGSVTESAEATTSETGAEGTASLVGQAGETVVVNRPAPGQTIEIQAAPGQTYVLNFAPGAAQVQVDGDNFILAFDDNGDGTPDSQVVFLDLASVVDSGGETPSFQVGGVDIPSDTLVAQALELAGQGETLDDVAAGPGATGGGASVYSDFLGDLLALLAAQGVIPPVELQFGLIELENEIIFPALEEGENPLLINEIGVNVALTVPDLPGTPPGDDTSTQSFRGGHGKEPVEKFNFIELINNSSGEFDASGNVVEILNPGGVVVSFTIPDGTVVPPGGTVVFYQSTDDNDTLGVEEIYVRVFDAAGNVVGGQDLPAETFWALGLDTTEAIAVNLVDGGESVDAFAANLTQAELAGLTGSPAFEGTPSDFLSPLLNLNLETFNGQFTGNHHIFSRVNLTDTDSQNDWTTNNTPTDGLLNDTTLVDGGEGGPDLNPWDPLNDDLNPMQVNADPLAGQNFLQAADGGDIVEGYGGPDFIQGAGGSDSLYGGSEEMYLDQSQKVLGQFFELLFGGAIFGDGAADLNHEPYFSDHNDFLFGEAGDDHMYGGSGGDFMIGGEGDDSMDGGTGDDQIYGDGHETINGMPVDGEGSGDEGAVDFGDDVIAGDALNNISALFDGGEGGGAEPFGVAAFAEAEVSLSSLDELNIGAAIAIMGGNDTIYAGKGDDKVSGDALATGTHAALAFSYADDSIKRPEDGLNRHDAGFGNDVIKGGEGNDSLAGDAGAIVDGGEGGFALAVAKNIATHGKSGAEVGSDFIKGGDGNDLIAGEALAVSGYFGDAVAIAYNKADGSWHPYKGKQGGDAGNDTIVGDGGEGSFGHDSIGGDAAAVGGTAIAKAFNNADDKYSDAGNDKIYAGKGDDVVAGDALAMGTFWGLSKAYNTAEDDAEAGNDELDLGSGNNVFSGDALTIQEGGRVVIKDEVVEDRSAYAFNTADEGGEAGNDQIFTLWGDDLGAGDAAEISQTDAHAHVENSATGWGSEAGNDTIFTDGGHDTVSGGSLAKGRYDALAKTENDADWGGDAGNDKIVTDFFGGWGNDQAAGDAMALSQYSDATAIANNTADDYASDAGNDTIWAGNGSNVVAGDAMAVSDGGEGAEAKAFTNNTATDGAEAGNDEILTGKGEDIVSGGSQAIAFWGEAKADTDNKATGHYSSAGNDYIDVDGGHWNKVAGDTQAIGKVARASGENDAKYGDGNDAGNDTIHAGWGSDTISGDAQAVGGYYAKAEQDNHAGNHWRDDGNAAGNDDIHAGKGDNAVAGDAQAIALYGAAKADSHNHADGGEGNVAGDDYITSGRGDDTVSGDAQAIGTYYAESKSENKAFGHANAAGNDFIKAGDGDNLVAGDSQAISSYGDADAYGNNVAKYGRGNRAGNDTIKTGDDADTVSGGAMAVADNRAFAKQENDANHGGEAGNDWISTDYDVYWKFHDDDQVAGDAMAVSAGDDDDDAVAKSYNDADDYGSAGNDTIYAGGGDNKVAGDAMAVNTGDDAFAYANNTADDGGVAGDDDIYTGGGEDIVSGDAQAIAADYAYAEANNTATGGTFAGNDYIDVDGGYWNKVAGDAQAISWHGNATAKGDNRAKYGDGTQAGNDTIHAGWGDDTISGGAQAVAKYTADASQQNHAGVNWWEDSNKAGNDWIGAGDGDNAVAGDAQAISFHGTAKSYSHNHADGGYWNKAGDDEIFTGKGDDTVSGDAQSLAKYYAEAKSENKAEGKYDTSAGNDFIKTGDGDNRVAGDAMAIASFGVAVAYGNNKAWNNWLNDAGNDTIKTGDDHDTVSGGALAIAKFHAQAEQNNWADDGAQAGDDWIYTDYDASPRKHDDDTVSGDALAISKGGYAHGYFQSAVADANNTADDWARAGNDYIDAGYGDNVVAGDALAINTGWGEAWASAHNTATDGGQAGNDTIYAGDGQHIIGGDAAALADANPQYPGARAFTHNKASGAFSKAGNDVINVGNGTGPYPALSIWVPGRHGNEQILFTTGATIATFGVLHKFYGSIIAGESVTTGDFAHAHATNEVAGDGKFTHYQPVFAGNDSITAGGGGHVIAGDALATGYYANASVSNEANDPNAFAVVGSDTIVTGYGNDLISGDAMATGHGDAIVFNDTNPQARDKVSQDSIEAGGGDDTVAGDALSVNGLASVNYGGDDYIDGGSGDDLIAGDALALGTGSTSVFQGGDDTILGGAGHDTIYGDTNDFSEVIGGNDFIDGGAGEWDVIYGGGGNDTIVFDAYDHFGGGRVDGGDGYDTLEIDYSVTNDDADGNPGGIINFGNLDNDWFNFEQLDLENGSGDEDLIISLTDVISMTDADNDLDIIGDVGDTVQLTGTGWVNSGSAGGFTTYTNTNDGSVSVRIEDEVFVTTS